MNLKNTSLHLLFVEYLGKKFVKVKIMFWVMSNLQKKKEFPRKKNLMKFRNNSISRKKQVSK